MLTSAERVHLEREVKASGRRDETRGRIEWEERMAPRVCEERSDE